MTNLNTSPSRLQQNDFAGFFAAILFALGLVLQWTELLCARIFAHNGWLFATLLGEIWNIISVSPSATQWHRNFHDGPLLLVITGAAILLSRSQKVRHE